MRDNGKPLAEAIPDISGAAPVAEIYARYARSSTTTRATTRSPCPTVETRVSYMPAGVAGLIVLWNYPLLMAAWKVAPAIAAGCASVLKPSEYTPLTALELARICHDVGLPKGVLNVVTGLGADAGAPLAKHPGMRKLAFTGSVPTGVAVAAAAAHDVKSVSLELGGKTPIVVFDDADIEQAVEWVMVGIFNQGQVCSATSRLILAVLDCAASCRPPRCRGQKFPIGDGMQDGVLLGPLVSEQHRQGDALSRDRRGRGRACYRRRAARLAKRRAASRRSSPMSPATPASRKEDLGPVLSVTTFKVEDEAVAIANDSDFGLAAAGGALGSRSRAPRRRCLRGRRGLDQLLAADVPRCSLGRNSKRAASAPSWVSRYQTTPSSPRPTTTYGSQDGYGWYLKGGS